MPSDYTTRSRETARRVYQTQVRSTATAPWANYGVPITFFDWESLYSRRNGWSGAPTGGRDVGGDFKKLTFKNDLSALEKFSESTWTGTAYQGTVFADRFNPSLSQVNTRLAGLVLGSPEMTALGTRFVGEASPVRPQAGLSVAFAELKREGIPHLSSNLLSIANGGLKARNLKRLSGAAGSDYLNWMFGWLPLINDLKALAKSVIDADNLMSQLYRDSGKRVNRKRGSSDYQRVLSESSTESQNYCNPAMSTYMYPNGTGTLWETSKTTRSTWFSGSFSYHIPSDYSPAGTLSALAIHARTIFGLSVDPEVIWNLLGFSWLADWVFNAGDVLHNISDTFFSQLVLHHGYVMVHTVREDYKNFSVVLGEAKHRYRSAVTTTYDVKQRMQATPFGFGLNWSSFTPYQLSILAALGVSRTR